MELHELQQLWANYDRKLDVTMQLNRRVLRETRLDKMHGSLRRVAAGSAFELVANLLVVIAVGSFIAAHLTTARFLIPSVALELFSLFLLHTNIRELAAISAVDDDAPVIANQRKLEELRILRIRAVKAIALLSPLIWTPLLIVMLRAFLHLDPYVFPGIPYLAANLLFGIAFIPLMFWIAKKNSARLRRSPFVRRIMDDLAGRNLSAASAYLAQLHEFEVE